MHVSKENPSAVRDNSSHKVQISSEITSGNTMKNAQTNSQNSAHLAKNNNNNTGNTQKLPQTPPQQIITTTSSFKSHSSKFLQTEQENEKIKNEKLQKIQQNSQIKKSVHQTPESTSNFNVFPQHSDNHTKFDTNRTITSQNYSRDRQNHEGRAGNYNGENYDNGHNFNGNNRASNTASFDKNGPFSGQNYDRNTNYDRNANHDKNTLFSVSSYLQSLNFEDETEENTYDLIDSFPLRIFVPAAAVGAIIGKQGRKIRDLTTLTKCKSVNIDGNIYHSTSSNYRTSKLPNTQTPSENGDFTDFKNASPGDNQEKLIWIHGETERITNATVEILKIIHSEGIIDDSYQKFVNPENPETSVDEIKVPLKIVADDRYVGRLIGRDGHVLKSIQEKSGARVAISSSNEVNQFNGDRQIAIYGSIAAIKKAETLIFDKLKTVFFQERRKPEYFCHRTYYGPHVFTKEKQNLVVYIPESAIGNVIGKNGDSIRNIMGSTFTKIKIFSEKISSKELGILDVRSKQFGNLALYRERDSCAMPRAENDTILFRKVCISADVGDVNAFPTVQHAFVSLMFSKNVKLEDHYLSLLGNNGRDNRREGRDDGRVGREDLNGDSFGHRGGYNRDSDFRREHRDSGNNEFTRRKVFRYNLMNEYELEFLCQISVPKGMMGRVVGKEGKSIKDLQRNLRIRVLIPPRSESDQRGSDVQNSETEIKIFGNLPSVVKAQLVIFKMLEDYEKEKARARGERPRRQAIGSYKENFGKFGDGGRRHGDMRDDGRGDRQGERHGDRRGDRQGNRHGERTDERNGEQNGYRHDDRQRDRHGDRQSDRKPILESKNIDELELQE